MSRINVLPKLSKAGLAILATEDNGTYPMVTEQEALQLICDLIKVFHVPDYPIEVIHFPVGVDRAQVLRAAADRIVANTPEGEGDGK